MLRGLAADSIECRVRSSLEWNALVEAYYLIIMEPKMSLPSSNIRRAVFGVAALLLALMSGFFVFYTARLLYVTRGLSATRPGGQGAYIGAIVFPVLALVLGLGAWRCVAALRR